MKQTYRDDDIMRLEAKAVFEEMLRDFDEYRQGNRKGEEKQWQQTTTQSKRMIPGNQSPPSMT